MMNDPYRIGRPEDKEHLVWKDGKSETIFRGPIFDITRIERTSTEGVNAPFIRVEAPEWVTVIPYWEDDEGNGYFVMVEQFRHGSGTVTREFPAGVVDEGEDPLVAAKRELVEETGIIPERIVHLGSVNPNSAFMNNHSHFYLAEGLNRKAVQDLDATEQVDVISVRADELLQRMGREEIYDNGIMMMALGFFLTRRSR